MPRYSLIGDFPLNQPLFYHQGEIITAQDFIAEAVKLSEILPTHRYVLNLCESRYHFILGFAATLIKKQTNILPPNRVGSTIQQICDIYSDIYCLVDGPHSDINLKQFCIAREKTATQADLPVPSIEGNHEAVIIYTSGSTGQPIPHIKTWQALITGAAILTKQFFNGIQKIIIGTIPAQHMFGLETTVMLPLQSGVAVYSDRPFFPEDVRAIMQENKIQKWLMTTPLHLRACATERVNLPGLEGVISATMPLSRELASDAEKLWDCPVYEIYGCTEAGMIAFRRTIQGDEWRTVQGVKITESDGAGWANGGHILNPIRIPDRIEIKSPTTFLLKGRAEDMIKIAGKRISLDHLNLELNQIEGVTEGTFFMPEEEERLVAFAVAPQLDSKYIVAALRLQIDSVFLPRPLYIVKALPRNENGKITRQDLQQLLSELRGQN